MKIKKNDIVIILKGSHRGQSGKVLSFTADKKRVVVDGMRKVSVYRKPRLQGEEGMMKEKFLSISISNVSLLDPVSKKPTRIGYTDVNKNKKRVAKKSKTAL
ncbi:MAG: 50S ribosomal protein L24 [Alphaproteobacteria bacterium]|nr:50S ribosomal protein L24 [Alphaproteobacteria bacterium]